MPEDHPLRAISPLIDTKRLRKICAPLYSHPGRPSVPPEKLFLAIISGYIFGVFSERKVMIELERNLALRRFVDLGLTEHVWDASTFSQNRRRRLDESGVLVMLFGETVKLAMKGDLISRHMSADGTLVRANASYKSFRPIEVSMDGVEYKEKLRSEDRADEKPNDPPPTDRGNPSVDFRGEKRTNG